MIRKLHLKNFRSVKSASVNIAPLTIIVGENSAGKSVLSRAVSMLAGNLSGSRGDRSFAVTDDKFDLLQPDGTTTTFRQLVNEGERKGKPASTKTLQTEGIEAQSILLDAEFLFPPMRRRDEVRVRFELTSGQSGTGASIRSESIEFARNEAFIPHLAIRLGQAGMEDYAAGLQEFADRDSHDWSNQRIQRRFERLEREVSESSPNKLNKRGGEPTHKWVEWIHRDPEGALARHLHSRPALLELLQDDNSDLEWFNDLSQSKPTARTRAGIDPMTALIEGVIAAFAQLRTTGARKNLSPSLYEYALYPELSGDYDELKTVTDELNRTQAILQNRIKESEEISSIPQSSDDAIRLSEDEASLEFDRLKSLVDHLQARQQALAPLNAIESGLEHLPTYAIEPAWGLPLGLHDESITETLMPGMSFYEEFLRSDGGVLSGTSLSMQFATASQKISRVIQLLLRHPKFPHLLSELDPELLRLESESRAYGRDPRVPLTLFNDGQFHDLIAESFLGVPGIGSDPESAEAKLTLSMVSLLAYVSPVKLRGLVWRELEGHFASEITVPREMVELAQRVFRPSLKIIDEPYSVKQYLEGVGRQGSCRIPYLHGNDYFGFQGQKNARRLTVDHGEVSGSVGDFIGRLETWGSEFVHLGALRSTAPAVSPSGSTKLRSDGSNAVEILSKIADRKQEDLEYGSSKSRRIPRLFVNHPQMEPTIGQQVANWMKYLGLVKGYRIREVPFGGLRLFVTTPASSERRDLSEVGSGVGQVVPILLAPLLVDPGGTVVIEEPEAHLHPAAQVALADFIVACVESGRQLIVETHSEHIVNRVRLRIAEGHLASSDASMIGVTVNSDEGSIYTANQFLDDGTFSGDWPSGFFGVSLGDAVELSRHRVFDR